MGEIIELMLAFKWAVLASITAGALCALVGTVLLVRRMILLGIALPQAASAGITLALLIAQKIFLAHLEPGEAPFLPHETVEFVAPLGSLLTVLIVLVFLAWSERKALFLQAQWGTVYVTSAALAIIFLVNNPYGEAHMATMLQGQVLTVTKTQFLILGSVAAATLMSMGFFRKEFLLTSFDPEMARSLRFNLPGWNIFLYVLLGLGISVSVMTLGPLFAFGYMLLPSFAARPWSRGMWQFGIISIVLAVVSAFAGCLLSFWKDWPLGASQVLTATAVLLLSRILLVVLHAHPLRREDLQSP